MRAGPGNFKLSLTSFRNLKNVFSCNSWYLAGLWKIKWKFQKIIYIICLCFSVIVQSLTLILKQITLMLAFLNRSFSGFRYLGILVPNVCKYFLLTIKCKNRNINIVVFMLIPQCWRKATISTSIHWGSFVIIRMKAATVSIVSLQETGKLYWVL